MHAHWALFCTHSFTCLWIHTHTQVRTYIHMYIFVETNQLCMAKQRCWKKSYIITLFRLLLFRSDFDHRLGQRHPTRASRPVPPHLLLLRPPRLHPQPEGWVPLLHGRPGSRLVDGRPRGWQIQRRSGQQRRCLLRRPHHSHLEICWRVGLESRSRLDCRVHRRGRG